MRLLSHPLIQLVLARAREFYREPEAVFWVYVFPLLMAVGLGIAFRNRPMEKIAVDVEQSDQAAEISEALVQAGKFLVSTGDAGACRLRLRTGKTTLVVIAPTGSDSRYEYLYDSTRPESVLARALVDDALQRAHGRTDPVAVTDRPIEESGSMYIDFLIPGLLGMNLMGGGLWGVGFVTVDMRIRKLLKRFLATPMKKTHFLLAIMFSRMLFTVPEVVVLLLFARLLFGVILHGSLLAVIALIVLGAVSFSGIGLLVASRARTQEAVSGLMNLVMLPMWLLSGIFFSSERFPAEVQPLIKALPLTALNDALRAVMLEGGAIAAQIPEMAILACYGIVSTVLALYWFRWE